MIQPQPAALADEYCSLLSLLAEHYPQALADLRDLLGASLAVPRVVELRERHIGLLVSLVASLQGEVPRVGDYQHARDSADEDWPDASSLCERYGSWMSAVKAAARLAFDPAARVPRRGKRQQEYEAPYSRKDLLEAIQACARWYGHLPGEGEYDTWSRIRRDLHRRSGKGGQPRIPTLGPFNRKFGGYEQALQAARAQLVQQPDER